MIFELAVRANDVSKVGGVGAVELDVPNLEVNDAHRQRKGVPEHEQDEPLRRITGSRRKPIAQGTHKNNHTGTQM